MMVADFNDVVTEHERVLKSYAISLINNTEDADDLYQETILKALLNREKYREGTNLKAWLYTIMRNIFINNYRRDKRFVKVESETATDWILTNKNIISNNGWEKLRIAEMKQAIYHLPDALRLSFELYYTGYKYNEIANLLQEPLGTVKSRIHFARRTLMAQIDR